MIRAARKLGIMVTKKNRVHDAQMEKVYRRRRSLAFGAIVAALVVVGIFIWALVMSISSVSHATYNYLHRDALTALNRTAVPATTAGGIEDCTADQLEMTLSATTGSVTSGGSIRFTAQIAHKGGGSCLVDGADSSRVLTITSGEQTVWSSALCKAGARSLLMSDTQKDTQTLTWDTAASSEKCGEKAAAPAGAGTYKAQLSLRDLPAVTSDPVVFQVTAAAAPAENAEGEAQTGDAQRADAQDGASQSGGAQAGDASANANGTADSEASTDDAASTGAAQ